MQKEPLENVSKMPFFNMMQEKLIELLDLNLPLGDELSAIFYILGIVTFENSGPEKCTSFFFFVYRKVCLCTRRVRCCFLHNKIVNIHACTQSVFFIVAIMNTHNLHFTD